MVHILIIILNNEPPIINIQISKLDSHRKVRIRDRPGQATHRTARPVQAYRCSLAQLQPLQPHALRHTIQLQYEKCLALNTLIRYNKTHTEEDAVKKWNAKAPPALSKWKKKQQPQPKTQTLPNQPQNNSPIKTLHNQQLTAFLQKLQSEIMMPIKMPAFFKHKNPHHQVIVCSATHFDSIVSYFLQNEFFKTDLPFLRDQLLLSQDNFFAASALTELLVPCEQSALEEVLALRTETKLGQYHCIFVVESSKYQLDLL